MTSGDAPGDETGVTRSDPGGHSRDGLAGAMGISSERVGRVRGSAVPATHGAEDISSPAIDDPPPEQSADPATGPEVRPAGDLPPPAFDPTTAPGHSHG